MTNILLLPTGGAISITAAANADLNETLPQLTSGSPAVPIDLTGIHFSMTVVSKPGDARTYLRLDSVSGGIAVNAAAGLISFQVPYQPASPGAPAMQAVPPGAYVFDLVAYDGAHRVSMVDLTGGKLTVTPGATR